MRYRLLALTRKPPLIGNRDCDEVAVKACYPSIDIG